MLIIRVLGEVLFIEMFGVNESDEVVLSRRRDSETTITSTT